MLQFMGFQRVEHNSVTELNWAENHKVIMTLEVGDGQGGLACCDSWGHKELDMTE